LLTTLLIMCLITSKLNKSFYISNWTQCIIIELNNLPLINKNWVLSYSLSNYSTKSKPYSLKKEICVFWYARNVFI